MIIIVDFGSQTTHLISRRLKELGVENKIVEPEKALDEIKKFHPGGVILSGGPAGVYEENAPTISKEIFELGIPILGICYGEQLMAHLLGGEVKPGKVKEYGPATLNVIPESSANQESSSISEALASAMDPRVKPEDDRVGMTESGLFNGLPELSQVWMSHGDEIAAPPEGFKVIGTTKTAPFAAIENKNKKIYAVQFHPEVVHTQFGIQILENFLKICGIETKHSATSKDFVQNLVKDIKDSVGNEKAICALSGGVDSSVAALLVHKAIGKNLTSVYIDSGLMREGETENLREVFQKHYQMNVDIVDAKKEFLNALKGITDTEKKRKAIGKVFIEVFEKEAKKINAKFLVQGTIYPDIIESSGSKHSQKIKSHHNVGGLPEKMNLILIEPLRNFYKDEVRKIGEILELPESITKRQPFPGPGLAVRIIGDVTDKKLEILRKADKIVREEIEKAGLEKKLWQYFAIFTGIWTTGVRGDNRVYGETIAVRAIEATDAMSANWAKIPYEVLDKISVRIVTEIKEVNRVVYDISNKPPATMEWE